MERSDGRLAPVTYLPGVQPSDRITVSDPIEPPAPPTFAGMYTDTELAAELEEYGPMVDDSCDELEAAARARREDPVADLDGERARAEKVSMHALTRRGQSRRELERILRARDLSDDVIAGEVERLERVGLVDDVALAQNLVGSLQERKGLGRSGVAAELARRMLSPAAIEYALELVDTGDELARARELAMKRAPQLRGYDHETAVRRLSGYLSRRGYGGSTVRAAVQHALSGGHPSGGVRFR
jgi:regulatory protein